MADVSRASATSRNHDPAFLQQYPPTTPGGGGFARSVGCQRWKTATSRRLHGRIPVYNGFLGSAKSRRCVVRESFRFLPCFPSPSPRQICNPTPAPDLPPTIMPEIYRSVGSRLFAAMNDITPHPPALRACGLESPHRFAARAIISAFDLVTSACASVGRLRCPSNVDIAHCKSPVRHKNHLI